MGCMSTAAKGARAGQRAARAQLATLVQPSLALYVSARRVCARSGSIRFALSEAPPRATLTPIQPEKQTAHCSEMRSERFASAGEAAAAGAEGGGPADDDDDDADDADLADLAADAAAAAKPAADALAPIPIEAGGGSLGAYLGSYLEGGGGSRRHRLTSADVMRLAISGAVPPTAPRTERKARDASRSMAPPSRAACRDIRDHPRGTPTLTVTPSIADGA